MDRIDNRQSMCMDGKVNLNSCPLTPHWSEMTIVRSGQSLNAAQNVVKYAMLRGGRISRTITNNKNKGLLSINHDENQNRYRNLFNRTRITISHSFSARRSHHRRAGIGSTTPRHRRNRKSSSPLRQGHLTFGPHPTSPSN